MSANDIARILERLDAQDRRQARQTARIDNIGNELQRSLIALGELRKDVDDMAKADEIARAVATELDARRRARFTLGRKAAAALAAGIVLIPAVHEAFTWWF